MGLDTKTFWLTDRQSQCNFDFDFEDAGNKQKSYKIIITKIFAPLDKAKPVTENIGGLNLAAVKHTTVQVTRLPL
jgi:hypothetical protein